MDFGIYQSMLQHLGLNPGRVRSQALPDKPLACYPPQSQKTDKILPHVQETCSTEAVKDVYLQAQSTCALRSEDSNNSSIPCLLKDFSIVQNHPALDIVYFFNRFQLEDLRGANTFQQAALDPQIDRYLQENQKRDLNILYPGSGSHLPPFLMVFSLMDRSLIDRARLHYTEQSKFSLLRMREYLSFWEKTGLISGLQMEVKNLSFRKEFIFRMQYRERAIELTFSLVLDEKNTPDFDKKFWASPEAVDAADLLIVHDNFTVVDGLEHYGDRYLHGSKDRLILMSRDDLEGGYAYNSETEDLDKVIAIPERKLSALSFIPGFFGCDSFSGGNYANEWRNVRVNAKGRLEVYREGDYRRRAYQNIRDDIHSFRSSEGGALLVTLHPGN